MLRQCYVPEKVMMGDSETVVAQTSAFAGCTYAVYSSTNYSSISSIFASDACAFADATTTRDLTASAAMADVANAVADGFDVGCEAYSTNSNSAIQGASATMLYGSEPSYGVVDDLENITGSTNISVGSSQAVGADISVNGNDVIEASDVVSTGISEKGNSSDNVHGFSSDHQLVDGSGISLFQVYNRCFALDGVKKKNNYGIL